MLYCVWGHIGTLNVMWASTVCGIVCCVVKCLSSLNFYFQVTELRHIVISNVVQELSDLLRFVRRDLDETLLNPTVSPSYHASVPRSWGTAVLEVFRFHRQLQIHLNNTFTSWSPCIWNDICGFCLFMFIKNVVETQSQNMRSTSNFKLRLAVCGKYRARKFKCPLWNRCIHMFREGESHPTPISSWNVNFEVKFRLRRSFVMYLTVWRIRRFMLTQTVHRRGLL